MKKLALVIVGLMTVIIFSGCAHLIDPGVYVGVEQAQGASSMMADHYASYSMDKIAELQQKMADLIADGGATVEEIEAIQDAITYELEFVESWDALDEWFETLKSYMETFGVEDMTPEEAPEGGEGE